MKNLVFLLIMLFTSVSLFADKPAYKIFEKGGSEEDFDDLLDAALDADIIFFGEEHNNPICHWLQLELTKALYAKTGKNLILGAEMFEADDQLKIDEYLAGLISQSSFEKEARFWNNYKTDYKPLLEFAKDSGLKFIATNIPRRYASLVSRRGFDGLKGLPAESKKYIAPLPIEVDLDLPGYKAMDEMFKNHGGGGMPSMKPKSNDTTSKMSGMPSKNPMAENFKMAQASKDATMAYFILKNLSQGKKFLHFNGSYHSNNFEGIFWFIKKNAPNLKVLTIASESQDDLDDINEDFENLGDYILIIPSDMTTTY